jgi:hypothetical protein
MPNWRLSLIVLSLSLSQAMKSEVYARDLTIRYPSVPRSLVPQRGMSDYTTNQVSLICFAYSGSPHFK